MSTNSQHTYVGEIQLFAVAPGKQPANFLLCDGSIYNISDYPLLYIYIGTTYGGDGSKTFGVPDLRDRVAIHRGAGPGLTPRTIGEAGGESSVTLAPSHLPKHNHLWNANQTAPVAMGGGNTLGAALTYAVPDAATSFVALDSATISPAGGSLPHENEQPTLSILFAICFDGVPPA